MQTKETTEYASAALTLTAILRPRIRSDTFDGSRRASFLLLSMTEPPSIWLIAPFAVVAGWHTFRAVRLRAATHGLVGGRAANMIVVAYVPAAISMLNAETLEPLAPLIEWARRYVLVLLVLAAVASEFVLRTATLRGADRLERVAETSSDPRRLAEACDALQALGAYDAALVGLARLATMDSGESSVRSAMAALYGIQRRFLRAEATARRAIELDPANGQAYDCLAEALHEQGRFDERDAARNAGELSGVDPARLARRPSNSRS